MRERRGAAAHIVGCAMGMRVRPHRRWSTEEARINNVLSGGAKGVSDSVSGRISRTPYQAAYETDMSQIRVSYGADTSVS